MRKYTKNSQLPVKTYSNDGKVSKYPRAITKFNLDADDSENIPYHARESAQPFTYGGWPEAFTRNRINHDVGVLQECLSESKNNEQLIEKQDNRSQKQHLKETLDEYSNKNFVSKYDQKSIQRDTHNTYLMHNKPIDVQCASFSRKSPIKLSEIESDEVNEVGELTNGCNKNLDDNIAIPKGHTDSKNNLNKRSETPSFPNEDISNLKNRCTSPYPMLSQQRSDNTVDEKRLKITAKAKIETPAIDPNFVKFAKDTSKLWYKPYITREDALQLLRNAKPGSFIIRNSTTFKNAYGLVLRVARPPANLIVANDSNNELVRHYLLEPTECGVRLKGYQNEPVFTSLSAFVYQHSVDELALPCKLIIPKKDLSLTSGQADLIFAQEQLLSQGAACNVLYLFTYNTESLTGNEAIRKASEEMTLQQSHLTPFEVHFKVSKYGITLTDNKRLFFFRRHYPAQNISYFGLEPDNKLWQLSNQDPERVSKTIFAFVARPITGSKDNQCHIFCDLSANQPASAIVSFTHKVLSLDIFDNKIV
ncbi:unnamed protein product [Ceratitis capitata]|uniref:(Mediterranean fruit fly) hypothetical protein n=1 Tax=Ceratitis capitata TaxID=7213 RepID=W8BHA7_CERCA|nr:unnamed protein product [Ceratitis capitata]